MRSRRRAVFDLCFHIRLDIIEREGLRFISGFVTADMICFNVTKVLIVFVI